jgi:hypothetical protein
MPKEITLLDIRLLALGYLKAAQAKELREITESNAVLA